MEETPIPARTPSTRTNSRSTLINVWIPNSMLTALNTEARRTGHYRSTVIRDAIIEYLQLDLTQEEAADERAASEDTRQEG